MTRKKRNKEIDCACNSEQAADLPPYQRVVLAIFTLWALLTLISAIAYH